MGGERERKGGRETERRREGGRERRGEGLLNDDMIGSDGED